MSTVTVTVTRRRPLLDAAALLSAADRRAAVFAVTPPPPWRRRWEAAAAAAEQQERRLPPESSVGLSQQAADWLECSVLEPDRRACTHGFGGKFERYHPCVKFAGACVGVCPMF